ncbi:MAG: SIR2 family protein [Chlorobi bacterium]|nr:SIR2 family protein [Chlorobiota bacterium]MCI0715735.1 SIR2 family protein [Chlorobiota bacterium]
MKNSNFFYLHGKKSRIENTIFSQDSYFKFYNDNKINEFLREIFSYCVLFIGYSLRDYEILKNLFATSLNSETSSNLNHYLLVPIFSKDYSEFLIRSEYFKVFSVKSIPYFLDDESYDELFNVIKQLQKLIDARRIPKDKVLKEIDRRSKK